MENAEEIMHGLEEFAKQKPKDIPHELDDYLGYVARTGDPVFKWSIIKCLFREKLLNVITDFYESTLTVELPPCPNVDPFSYERMKANLLEKLDSFHGAPFTVQRISELLTNPRKEYNRADKFMRAIEKNILVVSTREPGREADTESCNGMPDANDSGVETGFPCNDFSDPDSTAQNYEAKVEQAGAAYQVSGAGSNEGTSAPVVELPAAAAEEKDPESVICSTSASEQSKSSESTEHLAPTRGETTEAMQETAVASTSEASYDVGSSSSSSSSSHVQFAPSTSTAEPAGFPGEPDGFVETPVEPSSHPVEESVSVQMDTNETAPTPAVDPLEEVSTSDIGCSEEPSAQENPAEAEETTAEAVPLLTEAPEADLQCAETASFEDDRPSQSESAASQSDSAASQSDSAASQSDSAASQSDFLSQSESSGSDSNPSGEEPLPSEPEAVPAQVQQVQQVQEQVEVNVCVEAEPSVTAGPPASESSADTPTVVEAQIAPCEEPQPSEPTKEQPEPEQRTEPEREPELKSEPEPQPEPEPEVKQVTDSGDQSRETSVIHTTSSDVDEPMEVDECQAPVQTPLPW